MKKTVLTVALAGLVGGTGWAGAHVFTLVALGVTTPAVLAHGGHGSGKAFDASRVEETPYGRAADPKKATRTIRVSMDDRMKFTPSTIEVRRGETVRFVVRNQGKVMHEMVLGTPEELTKHAELMRKFPDMEHDDPNMVHVKPGETGELAWTFDKAGTFGIACLIPGHFEAGMSGKVVVK
ncbi:MAG: hypothetical protein RJA99_4622 [Pseudomonadota bacterium]|jgi:uncharacterized cupredoxin-like copper-binding protein